MPCEVKRAEPSLVSVLVIDDERPVRELMFRWLTGHGYVCRTACDATSALEALHSSSFEVVFSDIRLPGCSGLELLPRIVALCPDTAVVMLSALNDAETATQALTNGACGYLIKPTSCEAVLEELNRALVRRATLIRNRENQHRLERLLGESSREFHRAQQQLIDRLVAASMYRDTETGAHIKRTGLYCERFAQALGWSRDEAMNIRLAAPLHDVGKIGIPDAILQKPGRLTADEMAIMQSHTIIGARLLSGSSWPVLKLAQEIALYHHEWFGGGGYPYGIAGKAIPLPARILSIADVYDALTHDRCYRPAMAEDEALAVMETQVGTQFDPELFQVFLTLLPEFRQVASDHPEDAPALYEPVEAEGLAFAAV